MRLRALLVVAAGWVAAALIVFGVRSSCPDPCFGDICRLVHCIPRAVTPTSLASGVVVALFAAAMALWMLRGSASSA